MVDWVSVRWTMILKGQQVLHVAVAPLFIEWIDTFMTGKLPTTITVMDHCYGMLVTLSHP